MPSAVVVGAADGLPCRPRWRQPQHRRLGASPHHHYSPRLRIVVKIAVLHALKVEITAGLLN